MELEVTLDAAHVRKMVKKHLSIIGKRQNEGEGSAFAEVTLSSTEEDIIDQYVNAAAETFVSELSPLLTYYSTGDFLVFKVENSRWANSTTSLTVPFEGNFLGYVVAYVANAVLGMNFPNLTKKYAEDMERHIKASLLLIYAKTPPKVSTAKYEEVKGSCEINDNETKIGY